MNSCQAARTTQPSTNRADLPKPDTEHETAPYVGNVLLLGTHTLRAIACHPEEPADGRHIRCICAEPSCDGACETEILER
ncbi:hypothetical protein SAMN05216199_1544 [Pedococcus cremeus]|uniref:Uncharacterized protein n=1 Tax=Pedococcus cremeus TaxID=587636 RepID=A0A1H9TD02_9MICO|nr:hypothetical protein SAMN05216199_1544 [Pedococcus cremeus]